MKKNASCKPINKAMPQMPAKSGAPKPVTGPGVVGPGAKKPLKKFPNLAKLGKKKKNEKK